MFQQLVDGGSFAAATRKFGMSSARGDPPGRRLEDRLGVRLLQRATRRSDYDGYRRNLPDPRLAPDLPMKASASSMYVHKSTPHIQYDSKSF